MTSNSGYCSSPRTPSKRTQITLCTQVTEGHRRFGTQNLSGLKSTFADLKCKKKVQYSEPKHEADSKSDAKSSKNSYNPQKKQVQVRKKLKQSSVSQIIETTQQLLNHYFGNEGDWQANVISKQAQQKIRKLNSIFRQNISSQLRKVKSKQLALQLNTIYYTGLGMTHYDSTEIDKTVLAQWRVNHLLSPILNQWFFNLKQNALDLFKSAITNVFSRVLCEQFCQFMGWVTFQVFEDYYQGEITKGSSKNQIVERIAHSVVKVIICKDPLFQSLIYRKVYCNQINFENVCKRNQKGKKHEEHFEKFKASISQQLLTNSIQIVSLSKYLKQKIKQNSNIFPEVANEINKFTKQNSMHKKIKHIMQMRLNFQQNILTYQKFLIESKEMEQFKIIQKDEILSCLVLTILHNNVDVQILNKVLARIYLMYSEIKDQFLRKYECLSSFEDLCAATQHLRSEIEHFQY